jgi:hypothetical protein
MEIFPSLGSVIMDTYKYLTESEVPASLRIIAFIIMLTHTTMALTYIIVILFSSDIILLYIVLISCFIIYQTTIYFKRCLLTRYEIINSDILPTMSELSCLICSGNSELCNEKDKFEIFLVSMGLSLALVKILGIYIINAFTGKHYTCMLN